MQRKVVGGSCCLLSTTACCLLLSTVCYCPSVGYSLSAVRHQCLLSTATVYRLLRAACLLSPTIAPRDPCILPTPPTPALR
jgi:hypothetical protein